MDVGLLHAAQGGGREGGGEQQERKPDLANGSECHDPKLTPRGVRVKRGLGPPGRGGVQAAWYAEELRGLIAHCRSAGAGGYTPSDFPLVELDAESLAFLEGEFGEDPEAGVDDA